MTIENWHFLVPVLSTGTHGDPKEFVEIATFRLPWLHSQ
jgi:hypothetical protein